MTERGEPFFYLADTAWELMHRLDQEQADRYLTTRAGQGFTAYQAVLLAELDGLETPNPYGDVPLIDNDPARPNDRYFQHVDWIVDRGAELGLYAALLPTWGDKINPKWAKTPIIFTPENARTYASFLAKRYRDRPVLWVLGGDRPLEEPAHWAAYRAMGETLKRENPHQLIFFHPAGGTSSSWVVHQEPWLDVNMLQTGHSTRDAMVAEMITHDRAQSPVRPVLDGEPCYEDHPVMTPGWRGAWGWFDDYDVRKAAWRSVLSGAAGHTYGAHPVWMMWDASRPKLNRVRRSWAEALDLPGAAQMRHVRDFYTSRALQHATPTTHWLTVEPAILPHERYRSIAGAMRFGAFAAAYLPVIQSVKVNLPMLGIAKPSARWLNPQNGAEQHVALASGEVVPLPKNQDDSPDWVLVVEAQN